MDSKELLKWLFCYAECGIHVPSLCFLWHVKLLTGETKVAWTSESFVFLEELLWNVHPLPDQILSSWALQICFSLINN